jgi:hypothetical protein
MSDKQRKICTKRDGQRNAYNENRWPLAIYALPSFEGPGTEGFWFEGEVC